MMKRLLAFPLPRIGQKTELSQDEAHHATQVYRLGNNDKVELLDGEGQAVVARLIQQGKKIFVECIEKTHPHSLQQNPLPIDLAIGILKGEAMEWVIEKAVELGVRRLTPLITERTVVDTRKKGALFFVDRWQKIADQALKQCGRLTRLRVEQPMPLQNFFSKTNPNTVYFCDEGGALKSPFLQNVVKNLHPLPLSTSVTLFIGPEGGWDDSERLLFHNAHHVSLGPLVLRAETAALFAISIFSAQYLAEYLAKNSDRALDTGRSLKRS